MVNYIQIGKIVNTQGIRGEIKIIPLTDDPKRYEDLTKVYVEGEVGEFEIERVWYKKNFVILKFKNYNNINEVLNFKNRFILIHEEDAVQLPEDTYFIHQIIGLKVYHFNGNEIGEIIDVIQPGGNDVYVVKNSKKDILIPAIKEVVKEINIDEGKVIIDPIEGMI